MHQRLGARNSSSSIDRNDVAYHEPTAIDRDWEMVGPSSESAPELSRDVNLESVVSGRRRGPFLPLIEASSSTAVSIGSYAAKTGSDIAEQEATTAAIDRLTASVKAQSTDLANAVKNLDRERELMTKQRKRLQDENITEQAEIQAQLNRQVVAMHRGVMAKADEEAEKLNQQLKRDLHAKTADLAKEVQSAVDGEAGKRRRLVEELSDRVTRDEKVQETLMAEIYQQHRTLQQQLSIVEQRISRIEQQMLTFRSREGPPSFVQQDSSQKSRAIGCSPGSQQSRPTGASPRSRRDVNATNSLAQRQRAESSGGSLSVEQDVVRAHAMHVEYGQYDYDCELRV
ncbi:hypothetical protein DOTSEDRAFT_25651 [Dothistroma septosporum NZE10]|uniref:Uncharacterized protein n=1 Tax=Dothistroma septosporum (strain NZE10 / CBS 128990) TaxID=675120 RepID=N1PHW9_DOTSN|nr:hypothetical protein DOTSEDRAFT_25651 [Dothistroma septosporum NZE10]